MVIVELIGGLGNQMFQYAIGRRMAETLQTSLKLNIQRFENYPLRRYELNNFNIQEEFTTSEELLPFSSTTYHKLIRSVKNWFVESDNRNIRVKERSFSFDASVLKYKGNIYLTGYWQSEKYFKDIASILRKEFEPRNPLSSRSAHLLEKMQRPNSVAIHIRRGDYVTNSQTNKFHGVMSLDYYKKAMNYVEARFDNVNYYVFSDDVAWVKQSFPSAENVFIVEPPDLSRSYEDIFLMSMCSHNIIANSSFSWWSAWLNENPNKIVVAPQKWFNKSKMDTTDLIPDSWIRM